MSESISTSTVVAADRSAVLAVIADFPAYPEWANGVSACEVLTSAGDGHAKTVRFALEARAVKDSYVLDFEWGQDAVRFTTSEPGTMVTGLTGAYRLAETTGGTEVTYDLTTDLKMPAILGLLKKGMTKMIAQNTLKDLRRRVEAGTAS